MICIKFDQKIIKKT